MTPIAGLAARKYAQRATAAIAIGALSVWQESMAHLERLIIAHGGARTGAEA